MRKLTSNIMDQRKLYAAPLSHIIQINSPAAILAESPGEEEGDPTDMEPTDL